MFHSKCSCMFLLLFYRFSIFLLWRSCVCVCVWINISLYIKSSPRHVGVGWIMKTLQGIVRLAWLDGLVFKGDNWYIFSASIAVAPVQCVTITVNCQLALCMTQNCAEAFASLELSISMFSWNSRKPVSTVTIYLFFWTSFIWLRWQIIMPFSLHSSDVYNPHFFLFFKEPNPDHKYSNGMGCVQTCFSQSSESVYY